MEAEAASEDESSTMSGELSEVECKNQDDAESLKRRLNKVSSELEAACNKLTRLERKLQAYLYEEEAFHNDEMVVPTGLLGSVKCSLVSLVPHFLQKLPSDHTLNTRTLQ